ncbi:MAG TPA: LemA family protein [Fimbriimonadales bacterium]|nr:LemA family protein [Fimbriimonadales bacterium]
MGVEIWLVFVAILVVIFAIWGYNSLARIRNIVRNAWADIDVQLKRRADLIPALVETTKGYSGYEREVLERVTEIRSRAERGELGPLERAKQEEELGQRVHSLLAVVENYPELKASAQYMRLQQELSYTENKIADARRYYNAAVRDHNIMLQSFPLGLLAKLFGYKPQEYFETESDEREAPIAKTT